MEISLSNVMTVTGDSEKGTSSKEFKASKPKPANPVEDDNDSGSESNSEAEEQEKILDRKGKGRANEVKAFQQRDLVALAFAGDNVVQVNSISTYLGCRCVN